MKSQIKFRCWNAKKKWLHGYCYDVVYPKTDLRAKSRGRCTVSPWSTMEVRSW